MGGNSVVSAIVDVSARSRVFRDQPFLCHAWVSSPPEVLKFLSRPRSELRKLGIRLPAGCMIETVLQNHDWLSGHSNGFTNADAVSVFARGEGDGQRFYRVSFYASKARRPPPLKELLHRPDEEVRPATPVSDRVRMRLDTARRSMLAAPLHADVHRFLSPLTIAVPVNKSAEEAHRVLIGVTDIVRDALGTEPGIQDALTVVVGALQRPFNPAYMAIFRGRRDHDGEATFHGAFTSAMYAKAIQMFRTSGFHHDALLADVSGLLTDPQPTIARLLGGLEGLDQDFLAHVTVESHLQRGLDPVLDDCLRAAHELFATLEPEHTESTSRFWQPADRLELYTMDHQDQWWFLPGLIAFAINVWPIDAADRDNREGGT
jgi:hypothetical protein